VIGLPSLTTTLVAKSSVALNLALIGIIVLLLVGKNAEIKALKKAIHDPETGYVVQIKHLNEDLGNCRSSRASLQNSLNVQNRSIEAMAESGKANAEAGRAALAKIRSSNAPLDIKVREIGAAKPQSSDLCAEADKIILESVK
jgi:hypothetical protein